MPTFDEDVVVNGKVRVEAIGDGAVLLALASERGWMFRQHGTGASTALELTAQNPGNNNKDFLISTDGHVGIGTTTPRAAARAGRRRRTRTADSSWSVRTVAGCSAAGHRRRHGARAHRLLGQGQQQQELPDQHRRQQSASGRWPPRAEAARRGQHPRHRRRHPRRRRLRRGVRRRARGRRSRTGNGHGHRCRTAAPAQHTSPTTGGSPASSRAPASRGGHRARPARPVHAGHGRVPLALTGTVHCNVDAGSSSPSRPATC